MWQAHRDLGESLELREGKNAARQIAEEENKLCITGEYTGWLALGIEGLATATNRNTQASAGAWPANAVTDINAAIGKLESAGFTKGPYVLISRVAWIRKLDAQVSNTGITWRRFLLENDIVQAIYGDDSLYTSAGLTTNAIVCVPGRDNFTLALAQDVSIKVTPLPNLNQFVRVYEVGGPVIKRPTSICEITGLT